MAGLGHQPEGVHRRIEGKFLNRQELVVARRQVGQQLLQQPADQLGLGRRHLQ